MELQDALASRNSADSADADSKDSFYWEILPVKFLLSHFQGAIADLATAIGNAESAGGCCPRSPFVLFCSWHIFLYFFVFFALVIFSQPQSSQQVCIQQMSTLQMLVEYMQMKSGEQKPNKASLVQVALLAFEYTTVV